MRLHSSNTVLFKTLHSLEGDRVSIAMTEKNIEYEAVIVDLSHPPDQLLDFNPQLILPALSARDHHVYYADVILEYLNERHPYPALYPNDPMLRASFRLFLKRILLEWYPLVEQLKGYQNKEGVKGKLLVKQIQEILQITNSVFCSPLFTQTKDFSIIDCSLAPVFYWLEQCDIVFPHYTDDIKLYSDRLLKRPSVRSVFLEYR